MPGCNQARAYEQTLASSGHTPHRLCAGSRQDELLGMCVAVHIVHLFQILDLSSGCIVSFIQVLRLSDLSLGKEILTLT